ncbi:MAG: helix-turn-helix domain-containing protein [Natronospirillum sp.]|uniref:helix-turn-helix domain-containing protein n=1 Tax=Natronospirillum sp. TaxID=2812955 RepID=UPI0025F28C64|nr:helix-turn-helix domain-containing protein [Natronospirillum sp.]MCH8552296.1 helix-turn-helix domain-containing protein [Natronospirillum sp.]
MNVFQLFFWSHRLLIVGPAIETEPHQHHASQFALGLGGPVVFRNLDSGQRIEGDFAWIQPDTPHALCASAAPCCLLYTDAESRECASACAWFGHQPFVHAKLPEALSAARQFIVGSQLDVNSASAFVEALPWYQGAPDSRPLDIRLQRALAYLDQNLEGDVSIGAVAAASAASESWLSHAFTDVIGIPVRRFVLWARLRAAIIIAREGGTLTDAAATAGFSDAAHFTRVFREAFGITPSLLFGRHAPVVIHVME